MNAEAPAPKPVIDPTEESELADVEEDDEDDDEFEDDDENDEPQE